MKRKINGKRQRKQRRTISPAAYDLLRQACCEAVEDYETAGCEGCGTVSHRVHKLLCDALGKTCPPAQPSPVSKPDAVMLAALKYIANKCRTLAGWKLDPRGHDVNIAELTELEDKATTAIRAAAGVEADPQTLPGLLAIKFSELLRKELGPKRLKEVCGRNLLETQPGVCHSHDFTDANQIMLDAEKALGLPGGHDDTRMELVNEAWNMAKRASFYRGWPTPKAQFSKEVSK